MSVPPTDDQAQAQVRELLGKDAKEIGKEGKTFPKIMSLFRGMAKGYEMPGFAGTAYGLLNSVTEVADYGSRAKSDSHRLYSSLMGPADVLKSKARDQLLELVK